MDFVGYDGEPLHFKATENIEEMEAGQHYLMLFTELSSGCFVMWQRKLTWLSSETEPEPTPGIQSYQLYDVEVNFIELDQDSQLVFPPKAYDISGDWLPRDFLIYVKQPLSGEVFDIELAGNSGETLVFKSPDGGNIGNMSLSGEYLYAVSEIREPVDISSTFVIKQLTLQNVTDI